MIEGVALPARFLEFLGNEPLLRSTDDVLALALPLLEQVLEVHERGKVAPLEGVEDLMIAGGKLYFEHGKARAARSADEAVQRLETKESLAFEVAAHYKRVDEGDGARKTSDLGVVEAGETIERPSYVTRYLSWEHELGHHDPLTDIFVLGMVMASLALDDNLGGADRLEAFVASRSNLVRGDTRLHPVVARAIVRMTEVERHKRVQDLRSLIVTLKNYREQTIEIGEPSRETSDQNPFERRNQTYERLRDRLFDFSRRNRMLYFAPSGQTVNLTQGSVPLLLDVKSISPEAILTWQGRAADDIVSTKPVPLGRYLRFEDYPFLSSALDQLRLDANRSKNEVGFSPLRLSICFLHWHNLKEDPEVRITSPLLLLPIVLEKRKGVRDAVFMTAETDQAEVNPVLRQYLEHLYGVDLPERIDLSDSKAVTALHDQLARQVQASEPAVTITRVDKPRIDMILAQAKKRLEAYRKRISLSGRAVRSHRGFDYSYARGKFHPLGVQLFAHLVYPSAAPEREMHEDPRPRIFQHSPDVVEKSMYSLRDGGTVGGPYEWALDFASVTIANFNYRKMSLVRDYAGLLASEGRHASFDALFSDDARPVPQEPRPIPIEDRFDVMPADPTQASALARARRGDSFIIQGPPGTGKSQTITNLIADYVARGQRVLFVCEKRAAIDVVYQRLRLQGLSGLISLIHDSQADKTAFIKDLKETYEDWIARSQSQALDDVRRGKAASYGSVLGRAQRFRAAMSTCPPGSDAPLLSLLRRSLELENVGRLDVPADRLPTHRQFVEGAPIGRTLEQALRAVGRDAVFARHPLRILSDEVLFSENPALLAREEARALSASLEALLESPLARVGEPRNMAGLLKLAGWVDRVRPLIADRVLRLLDDSSDLRRAFDARVSELRQWIASVSKATGAASGWRKPLPREEVSTALALARRFEGSFFYRIFGWMSPAWWHFRALLLKAFDFSSRALRPSWTEILERLSDRYAAEEVLRDALERGRAEFHVADFEATASLVAKIRDEPIDLELQRWLTTPAGESAAPDLARLVTGLYNLEPRLARLVRAPEGRSPRELLTSLSSLETPLADMPALLEPLRRLAAHSVLAELIRDQPVTVDEVERAVCFTAVEAGLREHALDVLGGTDWDALKDDAIHTGMELRRANADALVERARDRFLENVRISSAPTDTLSATQKKLKREYAGGRKELEHEFGKVTRYRSIRDLATGKPGIVVRDLKPVWLMSPLSVADALPLDPGFDVVIFDEASQIPLEDAVPAAHRAAQTIVVGDEMQLPPTDFFGTTRASAEEEDDRRPDGYELDAHSLLTHAGRKLSSTMLGWHYRSRDESLIAFSNRAFYDGKLLTVPSVSRPVPAEPIVVRSPQDGAAGAEVLLGRPISHHRLDSSPYEQRRNAGEACYIAELVRGLLAKNTGKTIGIIAFSEAQQDEIETAISELGDDDPDFRSRFEAEIDREDDGQHAGLFIKNLENVQGDERDIIVISVCYGPDGNGRMLMNFGPINKMGGEKRLNVIFSRAKHHLAVVSSIGWTAITNDYNDGANCLRNYLRYAEAMSVGATDDAWRAIQKYGARVEPSSSAGTGTLEDRIAAALQARGYEVDRGVGTSQFRCNLGVRGRGEHRYRLGILVDDAAHERRPLDEVMHVEPAVLRGFGWKTLTVLHRDWYADSSLVMKRLETLLADDPAAPV